MNKKNNLGSKLLFVPLMVSALSAYAEKKPNIIFLVVDDQSMSTIGCWGGDVLTPNIDRLASEGVRFARAYAPASVSSPSRYSTLSGRYGSRCTAEQFEREAPIGTVHRLDNTCMELESDRPNVANMLQGAGYRTGMVGKWHLGEYFEGNNDVKRKEQWDKRGLKFYDKFSDPADPEVREALEHNHEWYAKRICETGFDYADNIYWANLKEVYNKSLNYHNIDWSVKGALDFMQQDDDRPFFLYFSTTLHHGPTPQISVPEKYERVTSKGYADQKMGVLPDRSTLFTRLKEKGISEKEAYTLWLDDAVGALLKCLEESGELDNTLIFYYSDHGIDQKSTMFEGGIKVPLIVWGKGFTGKNVVYEGLVSLCDLTPTALDAAGVKAPKEACLDGFSLLPVLESPDMKVRESVYSETGYARCVATERFKYIAVRYPEEIQAKKDRGFTPSEKEKIGYIQNQGLCALGKTNPNYFENNQLYDIQNDPQELNNLANNPKYKKEMKTMRNLMKSYLSKFKGRPFYDLYDGRK